MKINVKRMLGQAREAILYMPETIYQFAEYVASKISDSLDAQETAEVIIAALNDVKMAQLETDVNVPELLINSKRQALRDARFILQVLDAVMYEEENYVDEVRGILKDALGWKPIKWVRTYDRAKLRRRYPPYVIAAIEWWTTAILLSDEADLVEDSQKEDGDASETQDVYKFRGFTEQDLLDFRIGICKDIDYRCGLVRKCTPRRIWSDGTPDTNTLIDSLGPAKEHECIIRHVFPDNVDMYCSGMVVEVYGAYCTDYIKVWEADKPVKKLRPLNQRISRIRRNSKISRIKRISRIRRMNRISNSYPLYSPRAQCAGVFSSFLIFMAF